MRSRWLAHFAIAWIAGCGGEPSSSGPPAVGSDPSRPAAVGPPVDAPQSLDPRSYELRLELDPQQTTFAGRVTISLRASHPIDHVALAADRLVIDRATVRSGGSDRPATVTTRSDRTIEVSFAQPIHGEAAIVIDYRGEVAEQRQEGLFRQQLANRWYLFSQSQAEFARRITPCFDEPKWKPRWQVTLVVPPKVVALANGPVASERTLSDGRREIAFAAIPAMASYLLAVAVGPFELIDGGTVGAHQIPVRIAVAPGDRGAVAIVGKRLPVIADALERMVGRPLELAKLDIVAVPEFFGGMENTGLILLERSIVTADARDPADAARFERFAAHELAHQWFGNAVTPAGWSDLWLSEGLTSWLAGQLPDDLVRGSDGLALRSQLARLSAIAADDAADRRPIVAAVAPGENVDDRFDVRSYDKAAAIIDNIGQLIGRDLLAAAVQRFVARFHGGTATTADFVRELPPTARPVLASELAIEGTPVVDYAIECAGSASQLAISVRDAPGAGRPSSTTVAACFRHERGGHCTVVDGRASVALAFCPRWLIGNRDGRGYYRVGTPQLASAAPMTAIEQLAHADDVAAAALRGELPARDALVVLRALARGDDFARLAAAHLAERLATAVDDQLRPRWRAWLAKQFAARGGFPRLLAARTQVEIELRDRLAELLENLQPGPTVAVALALVDQAIAAGETPPPPALAIATASPAGPRLFDRIANRAEAAPPDQRAALVALLAEFGAAFAPRAIATACPDRVQPPAADCIAVIERLLERPSTRLASWSAIQGGSLATNHDVLAGAAVACHVAWGHAHDRAAIDAACRAAPPKLANLATALAQLP